MDSNCLRMQSKFLVSIREYKFLEREYFLHDLNKVIYAHISMEEEDRKLDYRKRWRSAIKMNFMTEQFLVPTNKHLHIFPFNLIAFQGKFYYFPCALSSWNFVMKFY